MGRGLFAEQPTTRRSKLPTYRFKQGSTAVTPPRRDKDPPSLSPDSTCLSSTAASSSCDKDSPLRFGRKEIPYFIESVEADDHLDDPVPPPKEDYETRTSETADDKETMTETNNENEDLTEMTDARAVSYKLKNELQARLEKMSENLSHMEAYQVKVVQLETQVAQLQSDLVIRETKEAELEIQCKTLRDKLDEAESLLSVANMEAKEQARKAVEAYCEAEAIRALRGNESDDMSTNHDQGTYISAKQQQLMSEGGKMIQVLRSQVFKLRSQNKHMKSELEAHKMANHRLLDANGEAGLSFASLSEKTKTISQNKDTLAFKLKESQEQIKALHIAQAELKEELQMKNAAYSAEVRSRLLLEKGMARIVDIAQENCRDTRVVEDILKVADECDLESTLA